MVYRLAVFSLMIQSSVALGQGKSLPVPDRLTKISQTIRGGKLPEPELIKQATSQPASINFEKIVGEWTDSPEFYTNMENWHRQIFRTPYLLRTDIEILDKSPPGLREALADEPVKLAVFTIRNNLPYTTLLDSQLTVRNSILKKFYDGADPTGSSMTDWKPMMRGPEESGVLTLRSMHLRNPTTSVNKWRTHANQVLEQWACQTLKPIDVPVREDDDAHGTDPACVSCHKPLDGIGKFFTRWERGGILNPSASIDDRGAFYETSSVTHQGSGLNDLGKILAGSRRFALCMVDKSWAFLAGRSMTAQEVGARADFLQSFWSSGYNLKELLKTIVLSKEFGSTE